jgi:hypothetical protein
MMFLGTSQNLSEEKDLKQNVFFGQDRIDSVYRISHESVFFIALYF